MIFVSAGHHNADPGASGNGYREADLTKEFRDLVLEELKKLGVKYITDKDFETLGQYLNRIQTGSGSVLIEFHFDAASSPLAAGTTALIADQHDDNDERFAREIVNTTSQILLIRNRGILTESFSHRGKLGFVRKEGINTLLEIGFITNENDMRAYQNKKKELAAAIAPILKKWDDIIK